MQTVYCFYYTMTAIEHRAHLRRRHLWSVCVLPGLTFTVTFQCGVARGLSARYSYLHYGYENARPLAGLL